MFLGPAIWKNSFGQCDQGGQNGQGSQGCQHGQNGQGGQLDNDDFEEANLDMWYCYVIC